MQRRDLFPPDLFESQRSQRRQDMVAERPPIDSRGVRIAIDGNMRAHVALRQIGQGNRGRGNRILALLDAVDNSGRLLARLVGGKFAVLAKRHSLGAARPPTLDDVDLPPGGIDPHSEAGDIMMH